MLSRSGIVRLWPSATVAALVVVVGVMTVRTAAAQAGSAPRGPVKGLVWTEPDNLQDAVHELTLFASSGVEAVRVDVLKDTLLYAVGDSLGIAFFQELPFSYMPARSLLDSLESAVALLDVAIQQSAGHPSARHFGLAVSSDNSVPGVCTYFETLAARVRLRVPGGKVYYVTHFFEDDACGLSVDFVLLDRYATDRVALAPTPDRFDAGRARAYGVGELGRRVELPEQVGLKKPFSAESQARFLEIALSRLLNPDNASTALVAVFVYTWREAKGDSEPGFTYSLTAPSGTPRPAWNVVRGFYTGRQEVFAFPAGGSGSDGMSWLSLTGLLLALLIGTAFAASPQFRQLIPRYFLSHGFYREAAAQGRDVTPVVNASLLLAASLSVGTICVVVLETVLHTHAVQTLREWMPDAVVNLVSVLAIRPWLLALLIGCLLTLSTLLWSSILSAGSRSGRALVPTQTLMIATWPQWIQLLILPTALVAPTFPTPVRMALAVFLFAAVVSGFLWSLVRALLDYSASCRCPVWVTVLMLITHPILLVGGVTTLFSLPFGRYLVFLTHLITRS